MYAKCREWKRTRNQPQQKKNINGVEKKNRLAAKFPISRSEDDDAFLIFFFTFYGETNVRRRFLSYSPRGPTVFLPVCPSRVKEKWGKWGGGGREREEGISRPNIVRRYFTYTVAVQYFQICDRTELNHQVRATFNLANSDVRTFFLKKSYPCVNDWLRVSPASAVCSPTYGKSKWGEGEKTMIFFCSPDRFFPSLAPEVFRK